MASPKIALVLFFLSTLIFSLQTHARDSQFFSKVSRHRDSASSTTINPEVSTLNNKAEEEKEPTFLPQTTQTGYGLYGHETGLDPPSLSSSSTYDDHMEKKNYASELKGLSVNGFTDNESSTKNNGVEMYYANQGAPSTAWVQKQWITANNKENEGAGYYGVNEKQGITANENYYKGNEGAGYYGVDEKQGIGANNYKEENKGAGYFGWVPKQGISAEDEGVGYYGGDEKQGMSVNNNYYRENQGAGYYGGVKKQGISAKNNYNYKGSEGAGYYGGVEKQGMSDTRFLENGKYYYDIDGEKMYGTKPNYIHYNGNNYNSNYENNYNTYEEYANNNGKSSMQGYRNQNQEEEEFDFDP